MYIFLQASNTWEEGADGRYWEEKREVGWTMDLGKTCLDQATFEVGAHNVRGGSQAITHKKYNIPLPQKGKYCSHKPVAKFPQQKP